jgi:hypothetical protein
MVSQTLIVESRHLIALSQMTIFHCLVQRTRRRRIAGGNDSPVRSRCTHANASRFEGWGSYEETRRRRDEFAAEFLDRFVSPVERSKTGAWGWTFCPECLPTSERIDPGYRFAMLTIDRVVASLNRAPGQRYCAPCLALAFGLANPNDVWRIMEMPPDHRPGLTLEHGECIGCHQARRTLSVETVPH